MIRILCMTLILAVAGWSQSANAEVTLVETKTQSGVLQTGGAYRAVYLGRLFTGRPNETNVIGRITGMYALVTISRATNVSLFGGNGNSASSFNSLLTDGKMVDTGMKFTNTNQTSVQTLLLPGVQGQVAPFALSPTAGTALGDMVRNNGYMDFWLATNDSSSLFTAPSNSGANGLPFQIDFRAIAVPEPSSLALGGIALGIGLWKTRRRKSKRLDA